MAAFAGARTRWLSPMWWRPPTVAAEAADAADGERQVRQRIDRAPVRDEVEAPVRGLHRRAVDRLEALDELFASEAVLDDLLDRAHLESVLLARCLQVGHPRHFAVVADDLDDEGTGMKPGEPRDQ